MATNGHWDWDGTVTRDFDRRIAALQSALEVRDVRELYELRMLRQTLDTFDERLERIESRLEKAPSVDSLMGAVKALWDRTWVKLAALALLATGNKQVLELLPSVFGQ